MRTQAYGSLCPEGHGILTPREEWTARGIVWCSHSGHGGNGRFYPLAEVSEGWFGGASRPKEPEPEPEPVKVAKSAASVAPRPATGPDCLCGCGEKTKGGRFRPGHDARYHSRLAKEGKHA